MSPIDIDLDDGLPIPGRTSGNITNTYGYSNAWLFKTNETNFEITGVKISNNDTETDLGWKITSLDTEKTLWIFSTSHAWDYSAKGYKFYYESDQCEKYLIVSLLKTEGFDKPFDGEQLTYNNMTYNVVVNRELDSISSIQYPNKTQYLIEDKKAVHLTGDETITGTKTFTHPIDTVWSNMTKGTAPTSNIYNVLLYGSDNNSKAMGMVELGYLTNKQTKMTLGAFNGNTTDSADDGVYLELFNDNGVGYAKCPAPNDATSTSSNKIATTGWVNSVGNNVVHLTGDETISGKKVFSNDYGTFGNAIVLSSSGTNCNFPFSFQLPSYTKGNTPSSALYCGIDFYGSKRTTYQDRIGNIEFSLTTAKLSGAAIQAYDCNSSSSTSSAQIAIYYPAGGTPYTAAPTPANSDSSTKIATTAFVKAQGYITSALKLPNYSSASNKSVGTQYTAANNCMVICNGVISTNGDRQTAISYFYINGAKYLKAEHFNVYGNGSAPFSFTVILQKGQTYKMAAEAYNCTAYKYVEIPLTA